jgi:RNA polymerase sigma-70 factor (ECF subfamily)
MHDREQAFLELVRDNEVRLWRVCRVYEDDTESRRDLYQDILVQLWRAMPSFARRAQAGTWLYRVALNTALSHRRRQAGRHETRLADRADPVSGTPSAIEQLETAQRLERLHRAIHHLGEVDRMLVTMYLDDRSYREMADVVGISESNVGVKLHRIKRKLAALLAGEAHDDR